MKLRARIVRAITDEIYKGHEIKYDPVRINEMKWTVILKGKEIATNTEQTPNLARKRAREWIDHHGGNVKARFVSSGPTQTPPFDFMAPDRKMSEEELAAAIRLDIEAELDAINLYKAHLDATDNSEARKVLQFVMNDEKEHMQLFTELLQKLDPDQKVTTPKNGIELPHD